MTIKVCACGACGRMCGLVVKNILDQDDMQLVCAVDATGNENIGKDIGHVHGAGKIGVLVSGADNLESHIKKTRPDVIVDFTSADVSVRNVEIASKNGIPIVVGTTGFSDTQKKKMNDSVKGSKTSAVIYPNMSVGVNILFKITEQVSKLLSDYDIEVTEAHHKNKVDSPSGTAMKLGEIISEATGKELKYGRGKSMEKRGSEVAIHSIRAGDIVGEHTVMLAGPGERIELTHKASSRQTFATGAVKAIRFINGKKNGKVYGMDDVLGLK